MNRTLSLLTALGAGLALAPCLALAPFAAAQAPAAAAPVATAGSNAAAPSKIALINFQQVVLASNEGQVVTANTQKKYEPKKAEIENLSKEVDALNKQLQDSKTISDADRAAKLRDIDLKTKHLNTEAEEAGQAYNAEWQEALGKVAQKIAAVVNTYADINGYTIVFDVSGQQNNVFWAKDNHQDISQAVVDAYNKQSGVAAPAPSGPSAPRPAATPKPAPKATTPH